MRFLTKNDFSAWKMHYSSEKFKSKGRFRFYLAKNIFVFLRFTMFN